MLAPLLSRGVSLTSCVMQVRACCHQALGLSWGQVEVKRTKGKKVGCLLQQLYRLPLPLSLTDSIAQPFIAFHERKEVAPNWNFNLAHEVRCCC